MTVDLFFNVTLISHQGHLLNVLTNSQQKCHIKAKILHKK